MAFKVPKGSRINKKIAQDIASFQSGIADGNADFLNAVLKRARDQYFVEGARGVPYRRPPGANLENGRGRKLFVKGKFVSRTGQLKKGFTEAKFVKSGDGYLASNQSPDFSGFVRHDKIYVSYRGVSRIILGKDLRKGKGRRQPFPKAVATVSNNWAKLVKHNLLNLIKSNKAIIRSSGRGEI